MNKLLILVLLGFLPTLSLIAAEQTPKQALCELRYNKGDFDDVSPNLLIDSYMRTEDSFHGFVFSATLNEICPAGSGDQECSGIMDLNVVLSKGDVSVSFAQTSVQRLGEAIQLQVGDESVSLRCGFR